MKFSAEKLREARQNMREHGRGVSQERFAEMLGVSKRSVERWETGATPRRKQIEQIARLTGLSEMAFFVGAGALSRDDREVVAAALEEFKALLDQAFQAALQGVRSEVHA